MNKIFTFFFVLILAGFLYVDNSILCATNFSVLDNIKVNGDKIELHTSGQPKYNIFKISNPPRLVVELFNVEQDLKQKDINVNGQLIKRIRGGQNQNDPVKIARVVIELSKQIEYKSIQQGNLITISLSNGNSEKLKAVKTEIPSGPIAKSTFSAISKPAGPKKLLAKNMVAAPPKAKIQTPPASIQKEIIVSTSPVKETAKNVQVSSPAVKMAPVKVKSTKAKIPEPKKMLSQSSKPMQKQAALPRGGKKSDIRVIGNITLPKTPVTMEYQDADIQDVLQVLSLRSGINIIAGTDVTGTISISLKDVPFDQAFNTILTIRGLTSLAVGDNILQVITPGALTSQRQQEVVFTKIYPLNYTEAAIVSAQIKSVFTSEGLKGDVNTDVRTNSILVSASLEGHSAVVKMLRDLDVKPQQVMIESRVVDVNLSDSNELGVSWSLDNVAAAGTGASVASAQRTHTLESPAGPAVSITQGGKTGDNITLSGAQSAMAVPTQSGISFAFGYISNGNILNTRLGALAGEGRIKLLSNPKVTTVNNKEAKIMVGEKIPYKTTTIGQGGVSQESFQFLDAGIQLTVTPTISPDKWITLKVRPVVSVPLAAPAGQAPTVRTRETDVTVMVKDGDTIVIGGLISDSDIEQMEKIPILGDIPLFGFLFKHKSGQKTRTELLIFITPKILEG